MPSSDVGDGRAMGADTDAGHGARMWGSRPTSQKTSDAGDVGRRVQILMWAMGEGASDGEGA